MIRPAALFIAVVLAGAHAPAATDCIDSLDTPVLEEVFVPSGDLYLYGHHIERPPEGYWITRTSRAVSINGIRVEPRLFGHRYSIISSYWSSATGMELLRRSHRLREAAYRLRSELLGSGVESDRSIRAFAAFLESETLLIDSVQVHGESDVAVWELGNPYPTSVMFGCENPGTQATPDSVHHRQRAEKLYARYADMLGEDLTLIIPSHRGPLLSGDDSSFLSEIELARQWSDPFGVIASEWPGKSFGFEVAEELNSPAPLPPVLLDGLRNDGSIDIEMRSSPSEFIDTLHVPENDYCFIRGERIRRQVFQWREGRGLYRDGEEIRSAFRARTLPAESFLEKIHGETPEVVQAVRSGVPWEDAVLAWEDSIDHLVKEWTQTYREVFRRSGSTHVAR